MIFRNLFDSTNFADGEPAVKRYANNYFTNMKSKHYDKAALQRFLQHRFLGKR